MDKIDLKNIQVNEQTDPKKLIEIINALRGQTIKTENKLTEIKDVNKPKRPNFRPKNKRPMYKSRIRTKAEITRAEMIHFPQLQFFLFEKRGNSFVFRYCKNGLDKQFSNVNYEVARNNALDWLVEVRPAEFYSAKEVFDYSPNASFKDLGDEWFYYLKHPRVKEITYKGYIALYSNKKEQIWFYL